MGPLDLLCDGMIARHAGDPQRIQHFLKVHSLARLIAGSEGIDAHTRFIVEAAAYVCEMGRKPARERCGGSSGPLQEQDGSAAVKAMLEGLYFPKDIVDRVAFLVGCHTYTGVHGPDHQILIEADCLVDLYEEGAGESAVGSAYRRIFRTESGKRLCRLMFGVDDMA